MGDKGRTVAFVVKSPDRACLGSFEVRRSQHRLVIDEIGDGVEALDRKPAEPVDDHPFGGRGMGGDAGETCESRDAWTESGPH